MKKYVLTIAVLLFVLMSGSLYSLNNFNYTGIAFNGTGEILASQSVDVNIKIILGTVRYEENHTGVTTDQFGGYTVEVGNGTGVSGDLSNITATKELRIQATITSGSGGTWVVRTLKPNVAVTGANTSPSGWGLTGNAGTTAGTNFIGTTDNVRLDLRTNNSIRATISNSGNVGIGTTTPGRLLQVGTTSDGGSHNTVGIIRVAHDHNNGSGGWSWKEWDFGTGDKADFGRYDNFGFRNVSDDWVAMTFVGSGANSGNVGIGTTTPSYKLDVNGTANFDGDVKINAGLNDGTSLGAAGQILTTDGTDVSWGDVSSIMADLTDGNGIADFTYNGSAAATVAVQLNGTTLSNGASGISLNLGNANTWTATQGFSGGISTSLTPNVTDNSLDLGTSTNRWGDLYLSGASLHIGADGDEGAMGYNTTNNEFTFNQSINVTGQVQLSGHLNVGGTVWIGDATEITGDLTVNSNIIGEGNTTLGSDNTDNVVFNADVNSNIIPNTDNTYDLGASGTAWQDVYATTFHGAMDGNAATATALHTARNFSVSGDVATSSAVSFDGTGNVNLGVSFAPGVIVDEDVNANAEIAVSKLADGAAGQILTTDGTDVSWGNATTVAWGLTGNAGTTAGTNFIGTTDNVPFELRVANGGTTENQFFIGANNEIYRENPNLGHPTGNARGKAAVDLQGDRTDAAQVASGDYSTVGGGVENTASGDYSTVGGGGDNTASQRFSTVGGGLSNTTSSNYSTVSGGYNNIANHQYSTVGGGWYNTASGNTSTVGGGESNTASGSYSTVGGGAANTAESYGETVVGLFDTDYTPNSTTTYNAADRLFVIGNGTSTSARSDALVMLKNGNTTLNGTLTVTGDLTANGITVGGIQIVSTASNPTNITETILRITYGTTTTYTLPAGTTGQIVYVANTSAVSHTVGSTTIAAGTGCTFVYVGGNWIPMK